MRRLSLLFVPVLLLSGCPAETNVTTDGGADAASDANGSDASVRCEDDADCDDGLYCNGDETCGAAGTCTAGTAPDCDDGIACTEDVCVEARRACESTPPDADDDGSADASCRGLDGVALGTDCDDTDATTYPGNDETCDPGHDEDCNPATYGSVDHDLDGHDDAACCNAGGACGDDCDDDDANVSPSAPEVCNGANDDCDLAIDETLPIESYRPDCDTDGYGDATATPIPGCAPPSMTPTCPGSGVWVTLAGDCNDAENGINIGNPEVCNGIDDDCDTRIDDIIDGTIVCRAGQTRACTNTCAVSGLETCNDSCLGWDTCLAAEVCNGCDDDADGLDDDGFECGRGTSESCTVPACGTTGTRVCSATCGWGSCSASESCNYCDDDGDGNFYEERPLASLTVTDRLSNCAGGGYTMYGPGTSCDVQFTAEDFDLWAELLDGTAVPQAGALWLDPATWVQGWGPTEIEVELEVTAIASGSTIQMPLGGWSVIIGHGGTMGVGTAQNRGIPTTIDGVAASWFWSNFTLGTCPGAGRVPANDDSVRFNRLLSGGIASVRPIGSPTDSTCYSGSGIEGSAADMDGPSSGTIYERIRLRYTPDDPTTATIDEEEVRIIASTPGVGSSITYTYTPSDDLPIGSGPLRIGITAGTYTQGGFSDAPGLTFGVPVRARARIFRQDNRSLGPPIFTYYIPVTRDRICP